MQLSWDQIRELLFGAEEIEQKADGLHVYKCTKQQRNAWHTLSPALGERAIPPTGVRLDFHTDADTISFSVSGDRFELHLDGRMQECLFPNGMQEFMFSLPKGEHRVTLIFPSHNTEGVLGALYLSGETVLIPHHYSRKFLFLGDSITQGWNSEQDSLSYAWRVSSFFNADCRIQGIGGGYFHPSVFEKTAFQPDTVFVAFGTNDYSLLSEEELYRNASAYLDLVRDAYPDIPRIGILPIYRQDGQTPRKMGTFEYCREIIRALEESRGFSVVDGYDLVPHLPIFFSDALHPNSLGFGLYAENLIREMFEIVPEYFR